MDARTQLVERKIRFWLLKQERKRLEGRRLGPEAAVRPPAIKRDPGRPTS